ncbi:hypothetical protein SAMN05421776_11712 [Nocardia farcinica]|uniref:Uncharacterized protein n=1 Tax=Nocardia farcinica TaxID=37329 RepID=A0A0H5NX11_NOCFR|nr:hypothetical protein [Nocardia farcinica]AXK86573.1 hypothetical protein DXT66_13885 [Nocardia farcinica]PFW99019.1 hypothetical protein CJ469_05619 [Nocardia farcinica]PFX06057.1 hypothetical protein CJ468_04917 [Nocardia farcinica]CRY79853.1 Uncharacterised protein [Nocardia farcinica]SIT33573.1 hypothetical protein SAMN05421776_11712 [Nocardia farcinica]
MGSFDTHIRLYRAELESAEHRRFQNAAITWGALSTLTITGPLSASVSSGFGVLVVAGIVVAMFAGLFWLEARDECERLRRELNLYRTLAARYGR